MKIKLVAAAVAAAALATPALADYYIVREGPSGQCRVVETRPADTRIVIIGDKAYKTRSEADKEVAVVCKH